MDGIGGAGLSSSSRAGKLGILAGAAAVAVAATVIIKKRSSVLDQFKSLFGSTKEVIKPLYIFLLFNFILLCILSSSFWSTAFASLLKRIHTLLAVFHNSHSSNNHHHHHHHQLQHQEQAFVAYFTRQTSTLFENFGWCQNNMGQKEEEYHGFVPSLDDQGIKQQQQPPQESTWVEPKGDQSPPPQVEHGYNRTVPFDGVSCVVKVEEEEEEENRWFSHGNDAYGLISERDVDDATSSTGFKEVDEYVADGMRELPYNTDRQRNSNNNTSVIHHHKVMEGDDEEYYVGGEGEEGNDMDATWKAIMEQKSKQNMLLVTDQQNRQQQQKPVASGLSPRQHPERVLNPASPLQLSRFAEGKDDRIRTKAVVQFNTNNKCPTPQSRRGSGGESGRRGGGGGGEVEKEKKPGGGNGGGGWRNVAVVSQDELYNRAEAFINRFKNGIQLQRVESYQRFLEIINR